MKELNTDRELLGAHALGWGWLVGMGFWTLFWSTTVLLHEPLKEIVYLPVFLFFVAIAQTILMIPGVVVFAAWYWFVPPARSNWGSAILLGLFTGPAVLVGIEMLTESPQDVLDAKAYWADIPGRSR